MAKTYLISGAGSGIGRAIAQKLSSEGHSCLLLGRTEHTLKETLNLLETGNHQLLLADIRDKESLKRSAKQLRDVPIDGLVANSGIGGENYWGENDRWADIIETNLTGTYNFVNTYLPNLLKTQGDRHIVITSSVL